MIAQIFYTGMTGVSIGCIFTFFCELISRKCELHFTNLSSDPNIYLYCSEFECKYGTQRVLIILQSFDA